MSMRDIVIGAGPSGIMAALALKEIGDDVMILEANEKKEGNWNLSNSEENSKYTDITSVQFSSVQSLSHVRLLATP